jgi:DNA helicase-2/ATP-dependent DNA helicase PcrA
LFLYSKIENDILELQKFWTAFSRNEPIERHNIENFDYFLKLEGTKEHKQELTLATIHATKGLEFKIVFLMGVNEGVLPDFRAKTEKQKDEERNTAYVAITRTKRCLYITYPLSKITQYHTEKPQEMSSFFQKALYEISDVFSQI